MTSMRIVMLILMLSGCATSPDHSITYCAANCPFLFDRIDGLDSKLNSCNIEKANDEDNIYELKHPDQSSRCSKICKDKLFGGYGNNREGACYELCMKREGK